MIPKQLQNDKIKFCRIKKGSKRPFEKNWVELLYSWEDISKFENENYGVLCGRNGLVVLDADDPELRDYSLKELPKSFTVKTGSGGTHIYYFCPEIKKKIVLQREKHYGEIQSLGAQVVGAGSTHPNGNNYEVLIDEEIKEISKEVLLSKIKPFMKEVQTLENHAVKSLRDYGNFDINLLPIQGVIKSDLKSGGKGEFYGENPWHGSTTGMNFWVNPSKNVGFCFRCNSGVNVAQAIGLNEGMITNCSDKLSKENFLKVLEIAYEKYGLRRPERKSIDEGLKAYSKEVQARQFLDKQPLFYDRTGMFWIWDLEKKYWKAIDDVEMLNLINSSMNGINIISSKERTEIINSLKQVGRLNIPQILDKNFIQFADGLIDIKHPNSTLEPSPNYFITNPIPWKIGVSEETPIMDKIFEEWVGEEYKQTLYEILAYSLIPNYPIHRIFCFIGSGLNGKSKFLELLRKFVGNVNCCATELDTLLESRFEVTRLHKKLVCQMGETNFSEMRKTSKLKMLSGGDLMGFEYKGKTPFEDINYAKIIISTNNLPSTDDKTIGFYRRWLIIDFPNQFTEKKDILSEIPDQEYENLAFKCIHLLKDLLDRREFTNEGSIEERMNKYEDKSNPFDKFWNENVVEDINSSISKSKFAEKLNQWCSINHLRRLSDRDIARAMKQRNVETIRKTMEWIDANGGEKPRYWAWNGVALND